MTVPARSPLSGRFEPDLNSHQRQAVTACAELTGTARVVTGTHQVEQACADACRWTMPGLQACFQEAQPCGLSVQCPLQHS